MKSKLVNQLVCCSGILFMTFPAWSAVPSTWLEDTGHHYQLLSETDEINLLDKNTMMLAKGGNGGAGEGGGQGGNGGSGGSGGAGEGGGQGGNGGSGGSGGG